MKKWKNLHYAWKIVIACVLMKLGAAGATSVSMSNFVSPIVNELGCEVSELTTFVSIQAISMALLYTTASRFLTKSRIGLVVGVAATVEMASLAIMSTYTAPYMFYISGLVMGIAQAFTGLIAIPIVINMWFKKKTGTVLGIVIAVGSAATVGYNMLSAELITLYGWRRAYLILAVMGAIITLPSAFALLKSPEEAGCAPYGAEDGEEEEMQAHHEAVQELGLTKKEAFRLPLLYVAWMACVLFSYGSGVAGYATPFATMELGQSINFGAAVGVCSSAGSILSSLIVGKINDRFGVKAGLTWGMVTTGAGYLLMMASYTNPFWVFPSIFIVGLGNTMYMVQCPLMARKVVGMKHYAEIWARMMVVNSLVGGGLYSSIGLFYDKLGSYRGAFIMAIGLYLVGGLLGCTAISMSEKKEKALAK